ncbi:polyphosphate:AMP phosphotransferase [Acidobacteriota bacterium]
MFETAEVGNKLDKEKYKLEVRKIRHALLEMQKKFASTDTALLIIIGGVEGAGKTATINKLLEWLDARGIEIHAIGDPTDEESERPPMWRFWRMLPQKGRITIFLGSWYTGPIIDQVFGRSSKKNFDRSLEHILDFEQMLFKEDFFTLKLWMHVAKKKQKKILTKLQNDPKQSWRVKKLDWRFFKKYDSFRHYSELALRRTNTPQAPWHIVEATDFRYRNLMVANLLLSTLDGHLKRVSRRSKPKRTPSRPRPPKSNIIRNLDMSLKLTRKKYERQLLKLQGKLNLLTRRLYDEKRSMILVFEGPDAAGKGGAIRRMTAAMDARNYRVISVAAPTDEECCRPYMWRFWRHLPRQGRVTIYDRSWYGRVLVERIEGFCSKQEWTRAFSEINAFEEQLTDFGIILQKYWVTISSQEQLRRFKQRETTPYKQYKITEEDWRNRAKWNAYEAAALEMIEKTSTEQTPWILVESEDKLWARIKVLETVTSRLEEALK